ncbi:secretin and TonB N-terminal domain-containing protein [Pseudomonas sp. USTB-Z]|uniref:Secretin and TonB N-terminal domain-containing protein n=1 Tax=Pseudomonas taiwanensis TaxID=470150 RepID=A0A7L9GK88_9PSED|nr:MULTISPECIES: secretin N-terminal domain-containing protein [Pseudomonas]MBX6688280.1 secretin and TonB N-terminal domain-containing protein [Pseudomonas sp. USTB-Z]MEB3436307.1 secretin N-terminal domain-containing protein [Pseudomonas sp. A2]QOJ92851.1 secretin and TonB N-terminal domain-containing protein [Pseudomonas taiwanensis]WQQ36719.1 secretin N-terminal domain-containing protein [Pseudomonas putida]HEN8734618.1 secretin and TonB N-terminal domain-containing protein [Pseudomonas pu
MKTWMKYLLATLLSIPLASATPYQGEPLSLNFQDVEVRAVLQVLADYAGVNLVASDAVQGSVTLRLQDVPWDQALDLVLRSKGLSRRQEGNVLLVAPAAEFAAQSADARVSQVLDAQLQPLRRELLTIHHAKAADLAQLLLASLEGGGISTGSLSVDERTNTLVVYLPADRLAEMRQLVAQLDVPVRQVAIEARIVEANVDYEKSLGVRWGGPLYGEKLRPGKELFVDLGLERAGSSIGLGLLRGDVLLDLELSAMEKSGNGEIISQPKVVTADKETARILKGTEVPYQETSQSGATSVSFREASLSLEVTPQITPDNRVIMTVRVTKDEPDYVNALNNVPPIRKNEVNAKVRVADGETIVIGGVYSTSQNNVVDKVPFFGDLPYVGRLFRRDALQEKKSELLVFLTPRIMSDQAIAVSR